MIMSLDRKTFKRLTFLYILALSAIAAIVILSQLLIQSHLNKQLNDSRVINVSGKQRMLSQKLSKETLLLFHSTEPYQKDSLCHELKITLDQWTFAHQVLQAKEELLSLPHDYRVKIEQMFIELQPFYTNIVKATQQFLALIQNEDEKNTSNIAACMNLILNNEADFLHRMDKIVYQFDQAAKSKVSSLRKMELILLSISLGIILFELYFVFRPAAKSVRKTIHHLVQAEKNAQQATHEIETLYASLEQSHQELETLNKDKYERKIKEQKIKSALIVEAQETERKRIARDIHDDIGQMLTALKFKIESIDLTNLTRTQSLLKELNEITLALISGVRIATFNLTPDVLNDYGLAAGIKKLSMELSKLTQKNIQFENKTAFDKRLDGMTETNLFRITQEAINNALKYANSTYILISISHSPDLLNIVIVDDGIGFDPQKVNDHPKDPNSGMGISFMKERINFINGRLFINSATGKGTRISLNVPLEY